MPPLAETASLTAVQCPVDRRNELVDCDAEVAIDVGGGTVARRRAAEGDVDPGDQLVDRHHAVAIAVPCTYPTGLRRRRCAATGWRGDGRRCSGGGRRRQHRGGSCGRG